MATAAQVKALVSSHAEGDDQRFFAVALQVAAQEARHGHTKFARELRDLVDQAKANESIVPRVRPVPIRQPRGELAGLMSVTYPKLRLGDMVLANGTRNRIERVLLEQRQRDRLREHSFEPLRKLLFVGPSGTGKTMTAGMIAGELGIPLFTIQLHSLITKYMGETAAKLRLIFDAMETRAVYFSMNSMPSAANAVRQMM